MLSLKIAVGQLCSSSNLSQNLRVVKKLLQKAQLEKLVYFFYQKQPTIFLEMPNHSIELSQEVQSNFLSPLLDYVKSLNGSTYLSIGIHLPGKKRVRNVHVLIDPKGAIVSEYQKCIYLTLTCQMDQY